jgi:hypothetical protein
VQVVSAQVRNLRSHSLNISHHRDNGVGWIGGQLLHKFELRQSGQYELQTSEQEYSYPYAS